MLKILSKLQIKALDEHTIRHEPIASIDLMERACRAFVDWFTGRFQTDQTISVVCGTGNNGGDGLGIARLLHEAGYSVNVWMMADEAKQSADFRRNLQRLPKKVTITEIKPDGEVSYGFKESAIIIDALLGTGLSRPVTGIYQQVIEHINQAEAIRIAVDLPSGLLADQSSSGAIIKAHHTVSFQLPKLAFLLPENNVYVGDWHIVPIGLDEHFVREAESKHYLIEQSDIINALKPRDRFSHKGNYGHALLIAGSYGKMGAAILSARSALRSGLGLLTVHIPACGYQIIQTTVPEAMVHVDGNEHIVSEIPLNLETFSAVGIGPGLGQDKRTVAAFTALLETYKKPIVIDADALNILSANRELIHLLPPGSILTPHPKEFERLVGEWKNDFDRLEKQHEFSIKSKCIVLLKGAHSSITSPAGNVYFNNTGNPGMATGGSGDVLTGILTALLAQGYAPLDAAQIGCWVHGLAGDHAARHLGQVSLIASDIIDYLPGAFGINR